MTFQSKGYLDLIQNTQFCCNLLNWTTEFSSVPFCSGLCFGDPLGDAACSDLGYMLVPQLTDGPQDLWLKDCPRI
jgi:hypothetical protein